MPSLSGIDLLCKLMSHETLKHIPVIMMSSLDSMSIVFKCLTKGAVDFLVKPVRKNELQNLWQHVWRRCRSSSGSGSGSQNQNTAQNKNEAGYDNNTGSIGGSENASGGLDIREGSDNGSGTQGSWTNHHEEVESSHRRGKWKRHCSYGSTFTQVKQTKKEKTQNNWMQIVETSAKACDDATGQDLVIAVPGQVPTHVECLRVESTLHHQSCQNQEAGCSASCGEGDHLGAESIKEGSEALTKAIDLIGNMGNEPQCRNGDQEDGRSGKGKIDTGVNCCHGKHKAVSDYNCMPELELTLNRPQANWNECSQLKDKCTLRQSDASAFSRYNMGGTHFSFPRGGSFPVNLYPLLEEYKEQYCVSSENTGSLHLTVPFEQAGFSKGSAGDAPDQYQLSQGTNNQDRGSSVIGPSGQAALPSSVPMKDETPVSLQMGVAMPVPPEVISFDGVAPAFGPALHPRLYSYPGVPILGSDTPLKAEREDAHDNSSYNEPHCVSHHVPDHSHHYNHLHHHHIQYHHHHHHHHHHEGHEHKKHAKHDEHDVDNAATTARGGSHVMPRNTLSLDGNCGESGSSNGNAYRSASGSNNNGINVPNGQSTVVEIPGTNGGSGTGNTVTSGTGSGVEKNLSARREAALMKFRQKRKERRFEKKVRYQSRKMFAEQRPRVKGQFVRHLSINRSEAGEEK